MDLLLSSAVVNISVHDFDISGNPSQSRCSESTNVHVYTQWNSSIPDTLRTG